MIVAGTIVTCSFFFLTGWVVWVIYGKRTEDD